MPFAEMAQDIIAFRSQPAEELLLVPANITADQRMQTAGIDNHVELPGGSPGEQVRVDPIHVNTFGFRPLWVNRAKMPDEYADAPPLRVIADLAALTTLAG